MNTIDTIMTAKQINEILTICARTQAILDGDSDLVAIIDEQANDDIGRQKGEFLGGCGAPQWHHVKSKGVGASNIDDSVDTNVTGAELAILRQSVHEHQTSIEANGFYNVRQLAHWKGGFKGDVYAKHQARLAAKRADHGYKFDKRRKAGVSKADSIAIKLAKIADKEARRAAKKAKK